MASTCTALFSCHSSEESEVSEPLFVMLQGSGGDDDSRREVRGLDGVVADRFQSAGSGARVRWLTPSAGGKARGRHRPSQLELKARARDVTASQLKAALVFRHTYRLRDQAG